MVSWLWVVLRKLNGVIGRMTFIHKGGGGVNPYGDSTGTKKSVNKCKRSRIHLHKKTYQANLVVEWKALVYYVGDYTTAQGRE